MRPAALVLGIGLVILIAFSVGAALSNGATSHPATHPQASAGSLHALHTEAPLSVIEQNGQPPSNVIEAIAIPRSATRTGTTNPGLGASYDEGVSFTIRASQASVLAFYRAEMRYLGWRTVTSGSARGGGRQIVGQLGGDDGFYWQLGVTVSASTFSSSGTVDVTRFTLRVLQVQDQS